MIKKRDGLISMTEIMEADSRNTCYVRINRQTGEQRPFTLEDHYAAIDCYSLDDGVPEDIAVQYDVSRNLYVYAWFAYRFFNIAEAQVLTVLELAMKTRIGDQEIGRYIKQRNTEYQIESGKKGRPFRRGMKTFIEYCRDHELVRNDGFSHWCRSGSLQAYYRAQSKQNEWAEAEMERLGVNEIDLPDIQIENLPPDNDYDHVQYLIDNTNKVRNEYAHGSTTLHNQVLRNFEMVSEFINQLYSPYTLTEGINGPNQY